MLNLQNWSKYWLSSWIKWYMSQPLNLTNLIKQVKFFNINKLISWRIREPYEKICRVEYEFRRKAM